MSRIPFIEARFFNPDQDRSHIERRLLAHLRALRERRLQRLNDSGTVEWGDLDILIGEQNMRIIARRAKRLLERREAASGLSHPKRDDRERLEVLRDGAQLIRIAKEQRADELVAGLHAEMPWMASATEIVWQAMRRWVREG